MRLVRIVLSASILAAAGLASTSVQADDAKPGSDTVQRAIHVCAACHGEGGVSTNSAFPHLAGQMPLYLSTQLKDFRSQTRAESDIQAYMWGVSALLDDATIEGLAEYYAGQEPARKSSARKSVDAKLIASGRKIFEDGLPERKVRACSGCHGAQAEGASVFPRLAGQRSEYVFKQLKVFSTRLRPHGVLMKNETAGLSDTDMRALAAYIHSL